MQRILSILICVLIAVQSVYLPIAKAEIGISPKAIELGLVTSVSGPVGATGRQIVAGFRSAFKRYNDNGGIFKRQLHLNIFDDHYDPAETVRETNSIVRKKKIFAIMGANGASAIKTSLPLILQDGIPMLFPRSGGAGLRSFHANLFNFRPSFEDEVAAMIDYAAKNKYRRIAILYQTDAFGDALRAATIRSLSHIKQPDSLHLVAVSGIARETTAQKYIEANFNRIRRGKPDVVLLATSLAASAPFIRLAQSRHENWLFLAVSSTNNLAERIARTPVKLIVSQVVPNPLSNEDLELVSDFKVDMMKAGQDQIGFTSFESYISGRILADALVRCGPNPTRSKLILALEREPFVFGNKVFDWNAQDHNGKSPVYLTRFDGLNYTDISSVPTEPSRRSL